LFNFFDILSDLDAWSGLGLGLGLSGLDYITALDAIHVRK